MSRPSTPMPFEPRVPESGAGLEPLVIGGDAPGLSVEAASMRGGSLANLDLQRSSWDQTALTLVRMTGVRLTEASLTDLRIDQCLLDLAALSGARLERVAFTACKLAGSDLQDLRGHDVSFTDCDLSQVDLTGATFTRTVMFGCTLDGVRDATRLKGVGMRWSDIVDAAGVFANVVGIRPVD